MGNWKCSPTRLLSREHVWLPGWAVPAIRSLLCRGMRCFLLVGGFCCTHPICGRRHLWLVEGVWGVVIGQVVEGEAAHGEGDGNPALAMVGAAEVEVPERARIRRAKFGRQAQSEELLVGLQVPETDGHVAAHGGELAAVGAVDGAEDGRLVAHQAPGLSELGAEVVKGDSGSPSDGDELTAVVAQSGP